MDASLIYCIEPKTKNRKETTENKNEETMMGRKPRSHGSVEWKEFVEQECFEHGVK